MKPISADQLLGQIRTLGRELQVTQPVPGSESAGDVDRGFGALLKNSLDTVNDAQKAAAELKVGFENGTTNKSLAEVMIASQKASLSFRAVTEVRNKLVTAYQDIMNMPV